MLFHALPRFAAQRGPRKRDIGFIFIFIVEFIACNVAKAKRAGMSGHSAAPNQHRLHVNMREDIASRRRFSYSGTFVTAKPFIETRIDHEAPPFPHKRVVEAACIAIFSLQAVRIFTSGYKCTTFITLSNIHKSHRHTKNNILDPVLQMI